MELSNKAPDGCSLRVGDKVRWENDYGVTWENTITGFNYTGWYNKEYKKYVHLDTESFWFPHDHNQLTLIEKSKFIIN